MSSQVDLSQLAIERGDKQAAHRTLRRHLVTRYVVPGSLVAGFAALAVWAAWDWVFPPQSVTVVPVLATQAEVQREGTPLFKAAGWIEPRPTPIRIAGLAPGVVEELLVVEDQPIAKGEPVAELVKDDARLAHQRARADLDLRTAEVEEAQARLAAATRLEQPVHLEAVLREAEALLAEIKTELKNLPFEMERAAARHEFARKDFEGKTAAKGAVAGRAIELAESELNSARALVAELDNREASLTEQQTALTARRDALRTQLELRADEIQAKEEAEAQLKAARARLELAQVALDEAQLFLDRMTVRSPVDGRVLHLVAPPGTRLTGGMGPASSFDASTVVTAYQPGMLQARVDVRFEDLPRVQLSQPVTIENPALAEPLTGRVLFISSLADIQKNTLEVKVAIDDAPQVFKPQMLVDVTFLAPPAPEEEVIATSRLRIFMPQELVINEGGKAFAWQADQSAQVARRVAIELGPAGSNGLVEVVSGLAPGDRVIVGGGEGLVDGQRIRVAAESTTSSGATAPSTKSGTMSRLPQGEHP